MLLQCFVLRLSHTGMGSRPGMEMGIPASAAGHIHSYMHDANNDDWEMNFLRCNSKMATLAHVHY